jgi:hypothetical protein
MALQVVAAVRVPIIAVRKRELIVNHELDYRKNKGRKRRLQKKTQFLFLSWTRSDVRDAAMIICSVVGYYMVSIVHHWSRDMGFFYDMIMTFLRK